MLVSVVIPVYNTSPYLRRCVTSVMSQTHSQLQIILVNDGSTDDSADICRTLANEDNRIEVETIPHRGVAAARNAGLRLAKGDFLAFVDSDDMVEPIFVEKLLGLIEKYDCDVAECDWLQYDDGQKPVAGMANGKERFYAQNEAIDASFYQDTIKNSLCRRIFRAGLFRNFRFKEGEIFEDLRSEFPLLSRAERGLVYTSLKLYHYIRHQESTMGYFSESRTVVLSILSELEQEIETTNPRHLPAVQSRLLSASFNMLRTIPRNPSPKMAGAINDSWSNILRLRRSCFFNPRVRLMNKIAIILSFLGMKSLRKMLSLSSKKRVG